MTQQWKLIGVYPSVQNIYEHKKIYKMIFIAFLFTIAKNWKQHKRPLTG